MLVTIHCHNCDKKYYSYLFKPNADILEWHVCTLCNCLFSEEYRRSCMLTLKSKRKVVICNSEQYFFCEV